MKRGQEVKVSRIPQAQGYVWAGFWQEDPHGIIAHPVGRFRKFKNTVHETWAIWLDIGGYLVL